MCGGADTPALRGGAKPLALTSRERQVVALIGEELTNRAIADRLDVSVRTVEGHVYRAMTKTAVTTRAELAAVLPSRRFPVDNEEVG